MKNTKIDWFDSTLNPVIGCKNGCKYCYAKKMNDRFHFIEQWNKPQFFPERLKQLNSKKGKSIFIDSMSDIKFWKSGWINKVEQSILENPQHNYIFLTKANCLPDVFLFADAFNKRGNLFFGKSITRQNELIKTDYHNFKFWSIEPLLEPIEINFKDNYRIRQVIIGAETGSRKGKVIPKKEWVENIVKQCDEAGVKVFMKESLREIMGKDFRQDELIWRIKK